MTSLAAVAFDEEVRRRSDSKVFSSGGHSVSPTVVVHLPLSFSSNEKGVPLLCADVFGASDWC